MSSTISTTIVGGGLVEVVEVLGARGPAGVPGAQGDPGADGPPGEPGPAGSDADATVAIEAHRADTTVVHGIADTTALQADLADARTRIAAAESAVTSEAAARSSADSAHAAATTGAHGLAGLLAAKADLVAGLVPTAQLPALAITDVFPVASQAAMLALTVQRGDVAVRSDLSQSFILAAEPASTLANWLALATPADAVLSVNGQAGVVVLAKADIGLGSVADLTPAAMPVSTAQQAALDAEAQTRAAADTAEANARATHTADTANPHGVTKAQVGLGLADNTADTAKPVSAAQQTALDAKLAKAGGTMTGDLVLAGDPTASLHAATRQYVLAQIAALIAGAPGALDTLNEIAAQLASDESAVSALTATVTGKLTAASNLADLVNAVIARANLGLGSAATQSASAFDAAGAATAAVAVEVTARTGADTALDGRLSSVESRRVQDEGSTLPARTFLNFVGAGVTATDDAGNDQTDVTIAAGGHAIEDEGTPLTQRATLNVTGAGVTASDAGGKTVLNVSGNVVPARVVASSALGATGTLDLNNDFDVWATYVLGAAASPAVLTLTNKLPGARVLLRVTQPSGGGKGLTVSDGTNSYSVPISTDTDITSLVLVDVFTSTDLVVTVLGIVVPPPSTDPPNIAGGDHGFETTISPWTGFQGAVAQSSAQAKSGTQSMKLTPSNLSASSAFLNSSRPAVTVGLPYSFGFQAIKPTGSPRTIVAQLNFFTAGGGFISTIQSSPFTLTTSWQRIFVLNAVAPATAATVRHDLALTTGTDNNDVFFDEVMLVQAATLPTYAP